MAVGVLEAIGRPISRARIDGMGISVEATVWRNSVVYIALGDGYAENVFGQFSSIVVKGRCIRCAGAPEDSGDFEMTSGEEGEFLSLVESGDYTGAYMFLLNSLSFDVEKQRINNALAELDAEQLLMTLSIIKSGMREASVMESPRDTLRRIAYASKISIA